MDNLCCSLFVEVVSCGLLPWMTEWFESFFSSALLFLESLCQLHYHCAWPYGFLNSFLAITMLFSYMYIYMSVLEGREARCVCNTIRREEGFWSAGVVGYCSSFYHSVRWSLVWTSSIVWFVFSPFSHKWNTGWKSGEMRNLVHD